jgi:tetratricopeptide (TPR) repeat protein
LGGLGSNNAMLQQAITSFRKSLEVRTKEMFPMEWAQTTNNLGAACFALAKRTKVDVMFEEAAMCFEAAIEIYRQHPGQKKRAKVIFSNLSKVREMMGNAAA